jgi:hypothetical protein
MVPPIRLALAGGSAGRSGSRLAGSIIISGVLSYDGGIGFPEGVSSGEGGSVEAGVVGIGSIETGGVDTTF